MRITIGVMGSASGLLDEEAFSTLETLGRAIAEHDCILITGGCPGLPYAAVQGVKEACGMVVVITSGRSGTAGEFAIAYDEGRLIGILTGTGGIADEIAPLVPNLNKPPGAVVLYDDDPACLIDRLAKYYHTGHSRLPNCFCQPAEASNPVEAGW